jgi:multidrug resistance efflux pump
VSPWTAGYITGIFVENNQFVKKGTPLFSVYLPPYELKVKELEHEQEFLTAQLKSCEAKLKCALEEIKTFRADIEKFRYLIIKIFRQQKSLGIIFNYRCAI